MNEKVVHISKSVMNYVFLSRGRVKFIKKLRIAIIFALGILIWTIFYPGIMTPDSVWQYQQAESFVFNDWHPPLMSLALHYLLSLGLGLGTFILIQCLLAIFLLWKTISLVIKLLINDRISDDVISSISLAVVLIFLLPVFPFVFYIVAFWKDSLLIVFFLCVISYLLWLFVNSAKFHSKKILIHCLVISIISGGMGLVRHNSIVILPIIGVALYIILGKKIQKRIVFLFLPILMFVLENTLVNNVFQIEKSHVSDVIMASDLVTFCKFYPTICEELPTTQTHINLPVFAYKGSIPFVWDETKDSSFCNYDVEPCNKMMILECPLKLNEDSQASCYTKFGKKNDSLNKEYFYIIKNYPAKFIKIKLFLFTQMLHPNNWGESKFPCGNNYLGFSKMFDPLRNKLCYVAEGIQRRWYFYWITGIHLVCLVLNLFISVYFAVVGLIKKSRSEIFFSILSVMPLIYYFSYILASTVPDYRLMYPSTILVQIFIAGLLISEFVKRNVKEK